MTARVQVIVEAKDASSGVLRGITSQLGDMGNLVNELTAKNISWGNVAEQATTLVIKGFKESYEAAQKYSQSVRDLALVSGTGAEESSRLLQVLDDFQISAEDVTAATRIMTKQGLVPTVETLAKLSDEYLSINDAQERNDFILKNLGRSGLQWVNVLNQGGDALRANSKEVNANLILTDKQVHDMELARLAQDSWNDTIEGGKVAIGSWIGSLVVANQETQRAYDILRENGVQINANTNRTQEYKDALVQAKNELEGQTEALKTNTGALQESEINYQSLISSIQSAQKAIDNYSNTQVELNNKEAELLNTRGALLVELNKTEKAYGANSKAAQELRGKLDGIDKELSENSAAVKKNEEAYRRWAAETVYSFALARAGADGSISTMEGEVLVSAGEALGLFDEKTAEAMRSVNASFDNLDTTNAQAVIANLQDQLNTLVANPYIVDIQVSGDVVVNPGSTGTGGTSYTCFVSKTVIAMADGTNKPIEDVQAGDMVISNYMGKSIYTRVTDVFHHAPEEMGLYYLIVNNKIGVTPNHFLFVDGSWVAAGELRIGDKLHTQDGYLEVTELKRVNQRVPTYNLHVDHICHNYYADGILAHNNKQTGGVVYAGQPTLVGEAGAEPFIPRQDGRILGHAESLHALSLSGGGGGSNIFYGNVTLQISDADAGGILSMR